MTNNIDIINAAVELRASNKMSGLMWHGHLAHDTRAGCPCHISFC